MTFPLIRFTLGCYQSGHVPDEKKVPGMKKKIHFPPIALQQSTGQIVRVNYPAVTINIYTDWPFLFKLLYHFGCSRKSKKMRGQLFYSLHDFFIIPTPSTHVFSLITHACNDTLQKTFVIAAVPYQNAQMTSLDVQRQTGATPPSREKCELINVQTEHPHLFDCPTRTLMNKCIKLAQHLVLTSSKLKTLDSKMSKCEFMLETKHL